MPACKFSQQAIEKAGTLDRKKVLDTIANGGPWNTIVGPVDLKTHIREHQWGAGQWQNGQFVGVSPERYARCEAGHIPQAGVVTPRRIAHRSVSRDKGANGRSGLPGPAHFS